MAAARWIGMAAARCGLASNRIFWGQENNAWGLATNRTCWGLAASGACRGLAAGLPAQHRIQALVCMIHGCSIRHVIGAPLGEGQPHDEILEELLTLMATNGSWSSIGCFGLVIKLINRG